MCVLVKLLSVSCFFWVKKTPYLDFIEKFVCFPPYFDWKGYRLSFQLASHFGILNVKDGRWGAFNVPLNFIHLRCILSGNYRVCNNIGPLPLKFHTKNNTKRQKIKQCWQNMRNSFDYCRTKGEELCDDARDNARAYFCDKTMWNM